MASGENLQRESAGTSHVERADIASGQGQFVACSAPAIARLTTQGRASLRAAAPLPDALARGLVVIQYRAENIRIVAVFGDAAVHVVPRIGHLHVTVDDSAWHWVDVSGEPLIVQGLAPGPHRVRIDLADPAHRVIDSVVVEFEVPTRQ